MCDMVTAPYEAYDTLVCASKVALDVVGQVAGTYADYLQDRHGGTPGLRPRLVHIPLGVDTEKFRPPTPAERASGRQLLGVADDEVMALFVGRISFHAKAHPYPMYAGLAQAARAAGRKVHLILFGTPPNPNVLKSFQDGAVFAPGVRVTFVDGTKPELERAVWHAADLFTSLSDNIQETFGLVIPEAMAGGLPVVASDWDGYRDMVVDGETGFLVPTYMVRDATADATSRLLVGEVNFDHFLCECNQAVAVDVGAAAEAFRKLIVDDELRRRLGEAGRRRALERYTWASVVASYEELWREQEAERRSGSPPARAAAAAPPGRPATPRPSTRSPATPPP